MARRQEQESKYLPATVAGTAAGAAIGAGAETARVVRKIRRAGKMHDKHLARIEMLDPKFDKKLDRLSASFKKLLDRYERKSNTTIPLAMAGGAIVGGVGGAALKHHLDKKKKQAMVTGLVDELEKISSVMEGA